MVQTALRKQQPVRPHTLNPADSHNGTHISTEFSLQQPHLAGNTSFLFCFGSDRKFYPLRELLGWKFLASIQMHNSLVT